MNYKEYDAVLYSVSHQDTCRAAGTTVSSCFVSALLRGA